MTNQLCIQACAFRIFILGKTRLSSDSMPLEMGMKCQFVYHLNTFWCFKAPLLLAGGHPETVGFPVLHSLGTEFEWVANRGGMALTC